MLSDFIQYLSEQIGEAYVWGGQHLKLTQENYVSVITKKETTKDGKPRGTYPDGETYADAAIAFCKAKFDDGATVLYAYDCSGLGMYWLQNVKHIYDRDANANTLMGRCSGLTAISNPAKGWWVFRQDSTGKATHIGYMVDDEYLVEAKGRRYGVVRTKFRAKDWTIWGIPDVFKSEIVTPPAPPAEHTVEVVGGSVYVRDADSKKGRILFTAHRGDTFPYVGTAPSGWYEVSTRKGRGFITNLPRYTKLV